MGSVSKPTRDRADTIKTAIEPKIYPERHIFEYSMRIFELKTYVGKYWVSEDDGDHDRDHGVCTVSQDVYRRSVHDILWPIRHL